MAMERVHVAPGWASTLMLAAEGDAHEVAPLDVGLLYLLAGDLSERMPFPHACSWDQDVAAERLRDMMDGVRLPPMRVDLSVSSAMARLGTGRSKALRKSAARLGATLNRGARLFDAVEVGDDTLRFTVANTPALLECHRAFGRALRGRGRTDDGFRPEDRAFVALAPALATGLGSANAAIVYARAMCWLRRTGMHGLPRGSFRRDDATGALVVTIPHDDLTRVFGLMAARGKASYLQAVIERVNHDLAGIGISIGARWESMGKRPGPVTVTIGRIPGGAVVDDTSADGGDLLPVPDEPAGGRWRPPSAADRREAEAARIEREANPPVPEPSRAKPRRLSIVTTVAAMLDLDAPIPPMPEPCFDGFLEKPEPEPEHVATLDPEPEATVAEAIDDGDDEPEQLRDAHDGWGWQRDDRKDGRLWGGSEDLAHLDEDGEGYDFAAPGSYDRPLPLPGDVHAGPPPRDDTRPSWLVRHLRYSVGWLDGGWSDRPMSAIQSTAMANWQPTALWLPGMGSQPAHVWSAADLVETVMRAMDRRRWQDIRSRLDDGESAEGILGQAMDSDDYPDLDARFGGPDAEPWDAHLVRPDLSPRDGYYADLAEQRTRDRVAAARAAREAAKVAAA